MDPLAFRSSLIGHGIGRRIVRAGFSGAAPAGTSGEACADFVAAKTAQMFDGDPPDAVVVDLTAIEGWNADGLVRRLRDLQARHAGARLVVVAGGAAYESLETGFAAAGDDGAGPRVVRSIEEALQNTGRR